MTKFPQGWEGWDAYAPFYDWENARTLGRVDVAFWTRVARQARGRVLELGCGTGRVTVPLARSGAAVVGVDRSPEMLARAVRRAATLSGRRRRVAFVRGDIRSLPFANAAFPVVIAPYGVLQSLLRDRDLDTALGAAARVLATDGLFGIDLVPDVPRWREYRNRVQLRGRAAGGRHLTLVETVRQDRRRRLTIFEECYLERGRGRALVEHRFSLTFRTLSVRQLSKRLERAGFRVESVLGDYGGRPWDARAEVWIILARKV
jgi:SAM-dependent methyltransferase